MSVDKAIRFGGRLACISDYYLDKMGTRTDFSKESVLESIKKINNCHRKDILELWNKVSNSLQHVGNQNIKDCKYWNEKLVEKYYRNQMREIKATNILIRNFNALEADLFETAKLLDMYVWHFKRIMEYRDGMDWNMVVAIEKLGDTFTFEELKVEMDNVKEEIQNGYI